MDEPVVEREELDSRASDDGEPVAEVGSDAPKPVIRKRAGRSAVRDLLIPLGAVGAVVIAILLIQTFRESDRPSTTVSGEYSSLNLGTAGEGAPGIGEAAPGFRLLDTEGRLVALEDFRGRPVLINFWATWCVPCRKETPDLIALQTEWGQTAQIVGVNYFESGAIAKEFATTFSINYPLPLDSYGEVTGSYKLTGLPETFFLDSDGIVRDHRIGQLRPEVARCIVAGIQAGHHDPKDCR